jgi:mono/diheme cytochrome c family protein
MHARPISGGTLRVLSNGRTAVAADADRDLVYVVDLVSGEVSSVVQLSFGDEPGRVVEDVNGRVHVALRGGGAVATIDPTQARPASLRSGVVPDASTAALMARRSICPAPRGLAYDAATDELHVACAGGELVSIAASPSATQPTRTLTIDRDLRDVVVSTNGRLLVSTFRSAEVYTVDGTGVVSKPQPISKDLEGRAPGVAWRMLPRPDGSCMVLHELSTQGQTVGTFPGAYGQQKAVCGGMVTSTVTVVSPDGDQAQPSPPLTGAVVGADVAVSPSGDKMAVVSIAASDPSQQVQFFDFVVDAGPVGGSGCWSQSAPPDGTGTVTDTGAGTDGLPAPAAFLPGNGQVVAVAYDPRGNVIVQSREPASLQILTQRRAGIVLSQDSRFDDGHQLFHQATSNQIACVSCHPEGGEDGRVWQFQGLGARRTQSLRGGIMDTAPFHWSGDEPNMTNLMKDVFQGRMAGGAVDAVRTTALTSWIDGIPTVPASRRADDATVARGAALFASAGCMVCHSGNDFTNNQTVDVGTGGMFQVPQLHGLGLRAPYLHTGCAATLRDRFTQGCGGDVRHSVGGVLTDAQITDLVGYLETL